MIKLDQEYSRQDFIDFLRDTFLKDYVRDVRPVGTEGLNSIKKAVSLGRSDSLDLQIFEFEYTGSANKRVTLTKEAFQLMKQSATFNALAVFYGQDSGDWRFSFLTANPQRTEKGKTTLAYSNPRRYSFFLGPNAKVNTPHRFLIRNGQVKNRDDLLSRFSVEIVTKEFFENYKNLFDRLLGYLKKDHAFQAFAGRNGLDTANFAKKLLGQIVFLYFLQRKGWLGAQKGESISSGDKDFLRSLFNRSRERKENFYNQYLEKLFYGALNKPPEKAGSYYRSYFDCQIPFLNGGLFEPPQDYDWEGEFLLLPDKLFSKDVNNPTHGDGILDIFDLYNFTVDESDYLDKEVSVDPEMLGKVFENLLEENLRKGKGTYYTPREIVNYMCEESLANYLSTETGLASDDIKNKYFPAYSVLGDEKFENRDVLISEQIVESLKSIKVVDPACGSGAFLVGMLQQITHLRYELEARSKLLGKRKVVSSEYDIKKQTIQNCIYGVDIDPGAVEIAKLRLWLSLVVDYELDDIEPLPNLDYKIMQGNSLLEELVLADTTVKLYDQQTIQKALGSKRMKNLFEEESQIALFSDMKKEQTLKNMKALQVRYFSQSNTNEKKKIKSQIEKIEHDLIEVSVEAEVDKLNAQRANIKSFPSVGLLPNDAKKLTEIASKESHIMAVLNELEKTGTKPFFLWHLHFADVFEEKGGFDVVIANPPYIRISGIDQINDSVIRKFYTTTFGHYDIYIPFIERGVTILRKNGILAYITPNKYLTKRYANKLRPFLLENTSLLSLIDTSQAKTFDSASAYPVITILKKATTVGNINIAILDNHSFGEFFNSKANHYLYQVNQADFNTNQNKSFDIFVDPRVRNVFGKISNGSMPLGHYARTLTGTPAIDKFYKWGNIIVSASENQIIKKPTLKLINVSNVKPYYLEWGKEVRVAKKRIARPLLIFDDTLVGKNKWAVFEQKKIVIKGTALRLTAAFDHIGYANLSLYAVLFHNEQTNEDKNYYFLGLLNSKLINYWYIKKFASSNVSGNYISFNGVYLEQIPIIYLPESDETRMVALNAKKIEELMSRSNGLHDFEIKKLQAEIDDTVFRLYGLDEKEISIVEEYEQKKQ